MDRRFKAAIEILALLVSFSGLIVLYKDAHYQVLILLGVVSVGLLIATTIHILTPPITYGCINWYVDIEDIQGKVARARKEITLVANQRGITNLVLRHMAASGFDDFSSNIGDIHGPVDEGGSQTVVVLLKSPLEVGKTTTLILSMRLIDSFIEEKESISYRVDQNCKEAGLHLSLPADRKARSVGSYMYIKDKAKKLDPSIAEDGRLVTLVVDRPPFGAKYVIEWAW